MYSSSIFLIIMTDANTFLFYFTKYYQPASVIECDLYENAEAGVKLSIWWHKDGAFHQVTNIIYASRFVVRVLMNHLKIVCFSPRNQND